MSASKLTSDVHSHVLFECDDRTQPAKRHTNDCVSAKKETDIEDLANKRHLEFVYHWHWKEHDICVDNGTRYGAAKVGMIKVFASAADCCAEPLSNVNKALSSICEWRTNTTFSIGQQGKMELSVA